jgi:ATP-dependent Clp protease ATP-binding subunit ClpA
MVAATTLSEYREHIQEDEALARRFRCVRVAEPTIEETRHILYSLRPRLEHAAAKTGKTIEIDEDARERIAAEGYSLAFGARFLKRAIDERIKLPITVNWKEGSHFHVRLAGQEIVVEATSMRSAARDQRVA